MQKDSALGHVLGLLIPAFLITVSYGALTEKPADTTLLPSGSLRLNCSSNLTDDAGDPIPIAWVFTEEGSQTSQSMTIDGGLTQDFRGSFTIDSSNKYDLKATLTNETDRYCGTYKCVDNNGAGDESASAAVATATSPTCSGVSQHTAGSPRQVIFTCSVETVCGNANVTLKITSGSTVQTGMNTVTWQTIADNVPGTDVICSADGGNAVKCNQTESTTIRTTTSLASTIYRLPALGVYAVFAFIVEVLSK